MARRSILVSVVNASIKAAKQAERERIRQHNAQVRYAAQMSREAKRAWVEDMIEDAESQTDELQDFLGEIDSILTATLDVDDYYDLEQIRQHVRHPLFDTKHAKPAESPQFQVIPEKPSTKLGLGDKLLSLVLRGEAKNKHHSRILSRAREDLESWERICAEIEDSNTALKVQWETDENARKTALAEDEARYKEECLARELEIQKANAELDEVIAGLPQGKKTAVETYADLVFAESVYPEGTEPEIECAFNELNRELSLSIKAANPLAMPRISSYKFQRNLGEIVEKMQTQKEMRERYENYICSVALRCMHEILEADRDKAIRLISVGVKVDHISEATGNPATSHLVEVATSREAFEALNLRSVVPRAALESLGAALSRNFLTLSEIPKGKSIRQN